MDMEKRECSLDTTDNPGADTQRLSTAPSFYIVATKTTMCIVLVVG